MHTISYTYHTHIHAYTVQTLTILNVVRTVLGMLNFIPMTRYMWPSSHFFSSLSLSLPTSLLSLSYMKFLLFFSNNPVWNNFRFLLSFEAYGDFVAYNKLLLSPSKKLPFNMSVWYYMYTYCQEDNFWTKFVCQQPNLYIHTASNTAMLITCW